MLKTIYSLSQRYKHIHLNTLITLQPYFNNLTYNTIKLLKEEWITKASKYGYGINANKAFKNELVKFMQTTIYFHNEQDLINTNLWIVFWEQYKGFTAKGFKKNTH